MRTLASLVVLAALAAPATAQSDGWRVYPAYNEVTAIAAAPDGMWAATDGGVFFYGIPSGELETVTATQGLRGGETRALTFDEGRGVLWVGYQDGLLERLDPDTREVTSYYAVTRADQYASRGIRRVSVEGDVLYLSTDFGVVVFDPARGEVRGAYARLADAEAGTPANDVLVAPLGDGRPGLWVATEDGLFTAPLGADNLQAPGAWTRDPFEGPVFSLAFFDDRVYLGGGADGERDLYSRRDDGQWSRRLFINNALTTLDPSPTHLLAVSSGRSYALGAGGGSLTTYVSPDAVALRDVAFGPDGRPWSGDAVVGLFPLPAPSTGTVTVDAETVAPPGPLSTSIVDADVGPDGVLWLVTERLESGGFAAVGRLDGQAWTSYRTDDPAIDIVRASFRSGEVAPDGAFWAGSGGDGVTVFPASGDPAGAVTYDETNSSLESPSGFNSFVVVRDVAFEGDAAWVANASGLPMHHFDGETWTGLRYPTGIPATVEVFRIAIDDFGQKWLALDRGGLAVWDTGDDPASGVDDQGLRFTGSDRDGVGLPGSDVRDVVVDGEGRVWLGTDRGLAYVFSPGSAFAGTGLATPQWPLTADGTSYLLRDVEVFDLEVDPAGQIWVGTSTGAYLLNAQGDGVVRTLTAATSPLPSDAVFAVAVDPGSGRVFFVTSEGLSSAPGDATRPVAGDGDLVVAPQPFRPALADGVVVRGLSGPTSQVRVLTVAGDVVFEGEVRGGSFRWDGRDRDGRLVPSGVYLVAAAGANGTTRVGKVAVLR